MSDEMSTPTSKPVKIEWKHANWVSQLGKWVWLICLILGVIDILLGWGIFAWCRIWTIIGGIIVIVISLVIILPKVSNKCAKKDWDYFYNWVWKLGNYRIPFVLFWGIIVEIFGHFWAGIPVIIIGLVIIFAGPKEYKWSE
jgi:hypothetical protein